MGKWGNREIGKIIYLYIDYYLRNSLLSSFLHLIKTDKIFFKII